MSVAKQAQIVVPKHFADARNAMRHVFVHDLTLKAHIGVHQHEKQGTQPIRVNIDLAVRESDLPAGDQLANVVCYEQVVAKVRDVVSKGHVNLVETLAEQIAALCLDDPRVRVARIRVEKLDVFADVGSVGVEIERFSRQQS